MKEGKYLSWLRQQDCCMCGRTPETISIHPHHCSNFGTAKRNYDEIAVPLCFNCHRFVHDKGRGSTEELQQEAKKYYADYKKGLK